MHVDCESQFGLKARSRFESLPEPSRGLLLGRNELAVHQTLGNLHGVQRRSLAQIVGDDPHGKAMLDRWIFTYPANVGRILARSFVWRDIAARLPLIDDEAAGRHTQEI